MREWDFLSVAYLIEEKTIIKIKIIFEDNSQNPSNRKLTPINGQ